MPYKHYMPGMIFSGSDLEPHNLYGSGGPDNQSPLERAMMIVLSLVIGLAICLLIGSCTTTSKTIEDRVDISTEYKEYVTSQQHVIDSLNHIISSRDSFTSNHEVKDSIWTYTHESDSLIIKDSTSVQHFLDGTKMVESWHWETHLKTIHDIQYKEHNALAYENRISILLDSISHLQTLNDYMHTLIECDTTSITSHSEIRNPEKHPWYFDILIHVYRACTVVLIFLLIVWAIKAYISGQFGVAFKFLKGLFTGLF